MIAFVRCGSSGSTKVQFLRRGFSDDRRMSNTHTHSQTHKHQKRTGKKKEKKTLNEREHGQRKSWNTSEHTGTHWNTQRKDFVATHPLLCFAWSRNIDGRRTAMKGNSVRESLHHRNPGTLISTCIWVVSSYIMEIESKCTMKQIAKFRFERSQLIFGLLPSIPIDINL